MRQVALLYQDIVADEESGREHRLKYTSKMIVKKKIILTINTGYAS